MIVVNALSISTGELKSFSVALLWNTDAVLLMNTFDDASTCSPVKWALAWAWIIAAWELLALNTELEIITKFASGAAVP